MSDIFFPSVLAIHPLKFNPFTAKACKISRLKVHTCTVYLMACNKSAFNRVHFSRSPFTCSCEGIKEALLVLNLALLSSE